MKITKAQLKKLEQYLVMQTKHFKPPTFAQWLTDNQLLLRQAKKNGYSAQDVVAFLDSKNIPCTTKTIEKATNRGLTKETRLLAKQVSLSSQQFEALTEVFDQWSRESNLVSKFDAVSVLKPIIEVALDKGYDFDDIAAFISVECLISGRTLKSLYNKAKEQEANQLQIEFADQEVTTEEDISVVNEKDKDTLTPENDSDLDISEENQDQSDREQKGDVKTKTTAVLVENNTPVVPINHKQQRKSSTVASSTRQLKTTKLSVLPADEEAELEKLFNL